MESRAYPLAFTLAVLLGPGPAEGCAIPVFRYALERWPAAPYDVVVFHRGALADSDRSVLRRLEQPGTAANANVTAVDLAKDLAPDMHKLWDSCRAGTRLPWMVVRAADSDDNSRPLFAGPLTPAEAEAVLDSPVRRQLMERLTRGESVIFVLLTGDPAEAEAATRLLDRELPRLQGRLRLPEPSDDGPPLLSPLPLRLTFTTLRLSRRDAREQRLIRMLLHGDDALDKVRGPIVFPVFGRGRVLGGLHGPNLTAARLEEEATFLCGACSCRVKELNPGTDLLLTADWNERLGIAAAAAPDVSTGPVEPVVEATVPEPEAALRPVVAAPAGPPEWLRAAIAVAVGLVVVTGVWAWVSGRAARR